MKWLIISLFSLFIFSACMKPYHDQRPLEFARLKYAHSVKTVTLSDGVELAYVDEGTGEQTIIFVHGLGSYLPAWQKNVEGLRDRYRCIALDLPGYGKSSKGNYPIGMAYYADVIRRFMEALQIEQAVLAGHSMGGQIAITLALQHPEKVTSLVLVAPAGFERFSAGEAKWFRDVVTADAVRLTPVQQIRANLAANFHNLPADAEFMVTDRIALRSAADFNFYCEAIVQSVNGMLDEPVYEYLPEISQPALIIFGENDNLIPNPYLHGGRSREIARIGQERIPDNRVELIPNCGHFAQFEKPAEVNGAIKSFLSSGK